MPNNSPVFTSYSQAGQDVFAYFICGKDDGTFLDIGASNADYGNNSYGLECKGWTGITIDYGSDYAEKHLSVRKMPLQVMDMTLIDWDAFIANNIILQSTVDYLSFDIDEASLPVLRKFPFNKLHFRALTIEHDAYRFGDSTRQEMRQILQNAGYELLVANVMIHFDSPETKSLNGFVPFEDWYVRTDLVDVAVANQFRANNKLWSDVLSSECYVPH
jgi:hypothetical protein